MPGQTGNPGGRPKTADITDLARQHSTAALQLLVDAMHKAPAWPVKVAAAEAILDRAWGKPSQAIDATLTHGVSPALVDAVLSGDPDRLRALLGGGA